MVKQLAPEPTEFQMSNEDFPALPGTSTSASATPASNGAYSKTPTSNHGGQMLKNMVAFCLI